MFAFVQMQLERNSSLCLTANQGNVNHQNQSSWHLGFKEPVSLNSALSEAVKSINFIKPYLLSTHF